MTCHTTSVPSTIHIQQITAKAHQRANNNIFRCFVSGNISLLVRAFLVYVRPVLEHNSVVLSPHLIQDIMKIKYKDISLKGFVATEICYADRLTEFDLPTLELRRLHAARPNLLLQNCFWTCKVKKTLLIFFRDLLCYKYERACT